MSMPCQISAIAKTVHVPICSWKSMLIPFPLFCTYVARFANYEEKNTTYFGAAASRQCLHGVLQQPRHSLRTVSSCFHKNAIAESSSMLLIFHRNQAKLAPLHFDQRRLSGTLRMLGAPIVISSSSPDRSLDDTAEPCRPLCPS